jgi:hypothetical protein
VPKPPALYDRSGGLVLEVAVANGCFLVHAARPLVDASIRTAERLAPGRGSCGGVVGAA